MRIQEALDRIDEMRPNMVKKEIKIAALSELDGLVYREIIQNHEKPGARSMTPMEQVISLSPRVMDVEQPAMKRYDPETGEWVIFQTTEERTFDGTTESYQQAEEQEEEFQGYTMETDPGTELLVPFPYDEIYIWWLASKVDWQNMEMDKYNNDRTLFNNAYDTMSDWYTRTHMPKQRTREFRI